MAALAGSVRTTPSLGMMAGLSISEASIYGRRPEVRALDFFYRVGKWCEEGGKVEEFVDNEKALGRILSGYGRPLAKTDERIAFTLEKAKEYGFSDGRHLKIAFEVFEHVNSVYGYSMNVAAVHAALAADMGFSCEEYQLLLSPGFVTGMAPCFKDAKARPEGSFFPIRCASIVYHGVDKRNWED